MVSVVAWMFHFALGLVFMYRFLRRHGVSRESSLIGAVTFVFSASVTRRYLHIHLVFTVLTTPLLFYLAERAVRRATLGSYLALGLVGANLGLVGHPQMPAYLWPVACAYGVWRMRQDGADRRAWAGFGAGWIVASLVVLGIAALHWLPFLAENGGAMRRTALSSTHLLINPLEAAVMLFAPQAIGADQAHVGGGSRFSHSWEWLVYIGIVPLLFVPFACRQATRARVPAATFFLGLLVLGLLFVASDWPSPRCSFARLCEYLPVWGVFHHIYRFSFLASFALSFLFAVGLDAWLASIATGEREGVTWPRRVWWFVIVLGIAGTVWWFRGDLAGFGGAAEVYHGESREIPFFRCVLLPAWFFISVGVWVVEACRRGWVSRALAHVLLLCVCGADLLIFGVPAKPAAAPEDFLARAPVTLNMPAGSRVVNVSAWNRFARVPPTARGVRQSVGLNTAIVDGLEECGGCLAMPLPPELYRFCDGLGARIPFRFSTWVLRNKTSSEVPPALWRLASVEYVIADEPLPGPGLATFSHDEPIWAYRVEGTQPRAYTVPEVIGVDSAMTALECIESGMALNLFEPASMAVAVGFPPLPAGVLKPAEARLVKRAGPEVVVEVNAAAGPTFLVLTDAFRPLWHAYVDGAEVPVFQTNVVFRGVLVPQGEHRVVFRYVDPVLAMAVRISGGTLALVVLGFLVAWWRRRGAVAPLPH